MKPPTQRQLRVGELVRHALSDFFLRESFQDAALENKILSVSQVRMSGDLKIAYVYVVALGVSDSENITKALNEHRKYIRRLIAPRINLKFSPELRFVEDDTYDKFSRIDTLLRTLKQSSAQTETPPDETSEDPPRIENPRR